MRRKHVLWLVGGLAVCLSFGVLAGERVEGTPYLLAGVDGLVQYPQPLSPERIPLGDRLYVVVLPETARAVVLRAISEAEYGSFQVQAVAPEMIDQQMLAAAIVLPVVGPADVAAFSPDLLRLLQTTVNEISGFTVFNGVTSPGA